MIAKETDYINIIDDTIIDDERYYNLPKLEVLMNIGGIYLKALRKKVKFIKYMGKNHILGSDLRRILYS